jgi:predicted house-cleaning noncanonical NTP pyrophosphatase (MazG superfamily)
MLPLPSTIHNYKDFHPYRKIIDDDELKDKFDRKMIEWENIEMVEDKLMEEMT